jgi:predicted Ser/Thr protein kinase
MEPDALLEAAQRPGRHPCPDCGVPYGSEEAEAGCPVCLLRRALQAQAAAQANPAEAGRFDHYELGRREGGAFDELGRGAMGVTYKAFDAVLHHPVALKVLDARVAADPNLRQRFLREARAAAQLRHPHVAAVFYYGVRPSDGQCFYAMEWVEGETLEARLRRTGPLPVAEALEIVAQVARALGVAEAQGVVHRDLKPANLMLVQGPKPFVKVIDFGLAKAAPSADEADLTQGGFVGTAAFASPEQFAGAGVDIRSDLYALGVTLYCLLSGQLPFKGTIGQILLQHLHRSVPMEPLAPLPRCVVLLVEKMMAKACAQRFQTPQELQDAIEACLKAMPLAGALAQKPRASFGALEPAVPLSATRATLIQESLPRDGSAEAPKKQKSPFAIMIVSYLVLSLGFVAASGLGGHALSRAVGLPGPGPYDPTPSPHLTLPAEAPSLGPGAVFPAATLTPHPAAPSPTPSGAGCDSY